MVGFKTIFTEPTVAVPQPATLAVTETVLFPMAKLVVLMDRTMEVLAATWDATGAAPI
jgi:hypothetical protein